jgi:DNA helicase HerA-like ATPase
MFVMDEAQTLAPSGAMTACTQSTLALASQAHKYGLGLTFATQSPKGLHNRIPGNATTQFYDC